MQKIKLTVYFENPFWVAVYERVSDDILEVCKVTFGAEPKDYEIYEYFLTHWHTLRFSPSIRVDEKAEVRLNPKRMQRAIKKQIAQKGIGTKAQQALKEHQSERKAARKRKSHQQKEAEQQRAFELRQQKRKNKHKGH